MQGRVSGLKLRAQGLPEPPNYVKQLDFGLCSMGF